MKTQTISKRTLFLTLLAALLAIGAFLAADHYLQTRPLPTPTVPPDDREAAAALTDALGEIFSVDYTLGREEWLRRVCAQTTPSGCGLFVSGSEALWQRYESAKIRVEAYAEPLHKLAGSASEQVWQLAVHLSAPLPGSNRIQDTAYAAAVKTDAGWYFDRFLLEREVSALLARTPTPAERTQP